MNIFWGCALPLASLNWQLYGIKSKAAIGWPFDSHCKVIAALFVTLTHFRKADIGRTGRVNIFRGCALPLASLHRQLYGIKSKAAISWPFDSHCKVIAALFVTLSYVRTLPVYVSIVIPF